VSDQIERALQELHGQPRPAIARFDPGPEMRGRVVVLPAAFNPPTRAHVHLLDAAQDRARTEHALALLTTRNVDKGIYGAPLADRVAMLLAARAEAPFAVAASNQARILDQAVALRESFPGATFDFVVGFDTLERLFAPRYYDDMERELASFFAHHRVWAANRGDVQPADVAAWIRSHSGRFCDSIEVLEIDDHPASLSSTSAREAAWTAEAERVVPAPVRRYISEHGLYRERD
jgi:nicotinic acid mononucleotide adenylyltransferase